MAGIYRGSFLIVGNWKWRDGRGGDGVDDLLAHDMWSTPCRPHLVEEFYSGFLDIIPGGLGGGGV
jgi:hypothetical protein